MRRMKKKSRNKSISYLLFLPAIIIVSALSIFPMVQIVIYSTRNWRLGQKFADTTFVGLDNYKWLFSSSSGVIESILRTFVFTLGSVLIAVVLGLLIALALDKNIRGRSFVLAGFIIPQVLTSAIVGLLFRMLYSENSLIPYILDSLFNIHILWASREWALVAAMIISVWQYTPFFILTISASLQGIPVELIEAAYVDGASNWKIFHYIKLPLIWPVISVSIILRLIYTFVTFEMIFSLYGGGPGTATEVLSYLVYRITFVSGSVGKGSAISVFMIFVTFVLIVLFSLTLRRSRIDR